MQTIWILIGHQVMPRSQIPSGRRPVAGRSPAGVLFDSSGRRPDGRRTDIARRSGHFKASDGGRRHFKSQLKFVPTSGPRRNRIGIGRPSDGRRTDAGRTPDGHRRHRPYAGKYRGVAWRHLDRPATVRSPGDARPASVRRHLDRPATGRRPSDRRAMSTRRLADAEQRLCGVLRRPSDSDQRFAETGGQTPHRTIWLSYPARTPCSLSSIPCFTT